MRRLSVLAISGFIVFGAIEAGAQASKTASADWALHQLRSHARVGATRDDARKALLRTFRATDIDGGGVSASDYALAAKMQAAAARGGAIVAWTRNDLDGDGQVTRAEAEALAQRQARQPIRSSGVELTPTEEQVAQTVAKLAGDVMTPDADRDGVVTFAEILRSAEERTRISTGVSREQAIPLSLDGDNDGVVSETEYLALVELALSIADSDGDGSFSAAEVAVLTARANEISKILQAERTVREQDERNRRNAEGCNLPKAGDRSKILVVSTMRGQALSNLTIGSGDAAVTVADVTIDHGAEPLYLVLTSQHPTVWRVGGAKGRIEHVVLNAYAAEGGPRAGVIGVPRDKVAFSPRANCLPNMFLTAAESQRQASTLLTHLVGRPHDQLVIEPMTWLLRLPAAANLSGMPYPDMIEPPRRSAGQLVWDHLMDEYPGGVVRLNPEEVVASADVRAQELLPSIAGLAQLVDRGALKVTKVVSVLRLGSLKLVGVEQLTGLNRAHTISERAQQFTILEKITFPSGLKNEDIEFVLAPGVPDPEGSLGRKPLQRQTPRQP